MTFSLGDPVGVLKGVGPKLGARLEQFGVKTLSDVLHWIPKTYLFQQEFDSNNIDENAQVVVSGELVRSTPIRLRSSQWMFKAWLQVDGVQNPVELMWFHFHWMGFKKKFVKGAIIQATGKIKKVGGVFQMVHPKVKFETSISAAPTGSGSSKETLIPMYPTLGEFSQSFVRSLVEQAFTADLSAFSEDLPASIRSKYGFPTLASTLLALHFPKFSNSAERQMFLEKRDPHHRRMFFSKAFFHLLEMKILSSRQHQVLSLFKIPESEMPWQVQEKSLARRALAGLDFELTGDQLRALDDIEQSFRNGYAMNRLLQGDVGCGKTVVAFLSASFSLDRGYQVAMMAPTEVLADQLFAKAREFFDPHGIQVGLLKGSLPAAQKRLVVEKVKTGEIDFLIGTHSLFQRDVEFSNLGLVIVDEQHRFGVRQRKNLKLKGRKQGREPHVLLMSATPIPRTLMLLKYQNLEISRISERPPGRSPVVTRLGMEKNRSALNEFIAQKIQEGDQVFVILPLIEESEMIEAKNVEDHTKQLNAHPRLGKLDIRCVHGRMKPVEREATMAAFRNNEFPILVATTVIEVGVDIPNANIIVIENAERFGLAQLHQLRGRVGRGARQGYCFLMAEIQGRSQAMARLKLMTKIDDGFVLAEEDLKMRGPGDLMGSNQTGHLDDLFGEDWSQALKWFQLANEEADSLLASDPQLSSEHLVAIRNRILPQLEEKQENFTTG